MRSIFGNGWVIGGQLDVSDSSYIAPSLSSQALTARCAKVFVVPEPGITPEFWENDQLGLNFLLDVIAVGIACNQENVLIFMLAEH